MRYVGEVNEQGRKLTDFVLNFHNYDRGRDEASHEVRVVLLGCVRAPGAHEMGRGVKIGDFIQNLLIKRSDHPVHSMVGRTQFYRLKKEMEVIDPTTKDADLILEDGDVIYVPAVVL